MILPAQQLTGRLCQAVGRNAIMVEDLFLGAGDHVLIREADDLEGQAGAALQQDRCARLTQPAENAVFLDRNDRPGFLGGFTHGFFVQRLDSVHAQHPAGDTFSGQLLGRGNRDRDRLAAGDEGQVAAVPDLSRLPDGEAAALGMHVRDGRLAQAHVDRMWRVVDGLDRLPGLEIIGRGDDRDVVDGAQGGEIMHRVMRAPKAP